MTLPARRLTSPARLWDPLREFEDLYEQMGQLPPSSVETERPTWVPAADLSETDDAFVVALELPGARRNDVNIEIAENELAITGEIRERERKGRLRRRTRRLGEFEYRVTLPDEVDAEKIDATLEDGMLTVRVPKSERAKPRRIEIRPQ
jgi:HSP20 family protein